MAECHGCVFSMLGSCGRMSRLFDQSWAFQGQVYHREKGARTLRISTRGCLLWGSERRKRVYHQENGGMVVNASEGSME